MFYLFKEMSRETECDPTQLSGTIYTTVSEAKNSLSSLKYKYFWNSGSQIMILRGREPNNQQKMFSDVVWISNWIPRSVWRVQKG